MGLRHARSRALEPLDVRLGAAIPGLCFSGAFSVEERLPGHWVSHLLWAWDRSQKTSLDLAEIARGWLSALPLPPILERDADGIVGGPLDRVGQHRRDESDAQDHRHHQPPGYAHQRIMPDMGRSLGPVKVRVSVTERGSV
jgi:hypothetical protein